MHRGREDRRDTYAQCMYVYIYIYACDTQMLHVWNICLQLLQKWVSFVSTDTIHGAYGYASDPLGRNHLNRPGPAWKKQIHRNHEAVAMRACEQMQFHDRRFLQLPFQEPIHWRYLPHIRPKKIGLCKGIYLQTMA